MLNYSKKFISKGIGFAMKALPVIVPMKLKKLIVIGLSAIMAVSAMGITSFAYDTSKDKLLENIREFAVRYEYREDDEDKVVEIYNEASGCEIETKSDGTEYEIPGFYNDDDALFYNGYFDLRKGEMNLYVRGQQSEYGNQCILYNSYTLLPAAVFSELGCDVNFDEGLYLTTISKDDITIEILPQGTSMRKNKDDGYYVPLPACARFVDDVVYVPARAVANELGINIDWDGDTHTVFLD